MEDYFGLLNELIGLFEQLYNDYLYKKSTQTEVDIDQFTSVTDYDDEINGTLTILANLKMLKNAPKFARLTRQRWLEYLEAVGNGEDYYLQVTAPYTVKEYEDIQTIAEYFDTDWMEILRVNDLKSDEVVGGLVINIPISRMYDISNVNLSVMGSQDGEMAMGLDLENKLVASYNGDIKVVGKP